MQHVGNREMGKLYIEKPGTGTVAFTWTKRHKAINEIAEMIGFDKFDSKSLDFYGSYHYWLYCLCARIKYEYTNDKICFPRISKKKAWKKRHDSAFVYLCNKFKFMSIISWR